jgi:hypothetical protein
MVFFLFNSFLRFAQDFQIFVAAVFNDMADQFRVRVIFFHAEGRDPADSCTCSAHLSSEFSVVPILGCSAHAA